MLIQSHQPHQSTVHYLDHANVVQGDFEADEGGRYIINDDRRDPAGRISKGRLRDRNADSESDLEDEFDDLRARGRPSAGKSFICCCVNHTWALLAVGGSACCYADARF